MRYILEGDGDPDDGRVPEMDHAGGPPVSQYHPRLGVIILNRLWAGETVAAVCADAAMPCSATLKRWRRVHAEFGRAYEEMMDARAARRREQARLRREVRRERMLVEIELGLRHRLTLFGGRRSTYDRGWAEAFCARVANGEAVRAVCADPSMPSRCQVYSWLRRQPEFTAMYTEAKREAVSWLAFNVELATDPILDGAVGAAQFAEIRQRVRVLEGRIGLLQPKTYR